MESMVGCAEHLLLLLLCYWMDDRWAAHSDSLLVPALDLVQLSSRAADLRQCFLCAGQDSCRIVVPQRACHGRLACACTAKVLSSYSYVRVRSIIMEQILHRCAFGCRSGQLGGIARMVTRRNDLQEALALWPNAFKPFHQQARTKQGADESKQIHPSYSAWVKPAY